MISPEDALKTLFGTIDSDEVKGELNKWFDFGSDLHNSQISNLNTEQLALFMDKIPDLVLILYNVLQSDRSEIK